MKLRTGQAGKICLEAAHQIGRIALLLFMLGLTALGLFAFSLSRHPISVPHLTSWLATTASGDGITVQVDKGELAWAGYREGGAVPLVLRLSGISVHSAAGALLLTIPQADAVVPPQDVFGGRAAILLQASAARISGSEAPVTIHANIWPGSGYSFSRGAIFVSIGAGVLGPVDVGVPISAASFTLQTSPGMADITDGIATLAPIGGSAPHATFTFTARRDTNWAASLHATVDAVRAEELGRYWPEPALRLTREWVVTHITAGTASNAAYTFTLTAPGDLSSLDLTGAAGGFDGTGLTLYWVMNGWPVKGLDGHFSMPDSDEAIIAATAGQVGNVVMRQGRMDITGMSHRDQTGVLNVSLAGAAPDVLAALNAPPLALLRNAPPMVLQTTGQVDGTLGLVIPFERALSFNDVKLDADVNLHGFSMPSVVPQLGFSKGEAHIRTDGHSLTMQARAQLAGEPVSMAMTGDFVGAGTEDLTLKGAAGPQLWHVLGLDSATDASGTAPFTIHVYGAATGAQAADLQADLTPAALALPMAGWGKKTGEKGDFSASMSLNNGALVSVRNFAAHAPGLVVEGVEQGGALVFSTADIGRTQAKGVLRWPVVKGGDWTADFSGPVLDIRQSKPGHAGQGPAKPGYAGEGPAKPGAAVLPPVAPSGPGWTARLNFAQLYLAEAPAPALARFAITAQGQGGTLLQAQGAADGLTLAVTPQTPTSRTLVLHGADAGALLRALGEYPHLQGGTLDLRAVYGGGQAVTGKVSLLAARFANAPDVTKFLQALTLYGLADAASGPGLKISRAEIPFTLQDGVLTLHGARAWSSSLGFTASGSFDLVNNACDLDTTIVPLYALNALPGKIPLIGKLFSPEKGGGLLAMRAHISGPIDHASVSINPLSALTPGFLRSIFGIGEKPGG